MFSLVIKEKKKKKKLCIQTTAIKIFPYFFGDLQGCQIERTKSLKRTAQLSVVVVMGSGVSILYSSQSLERRWVCDLSNVLALNEPAGYLSIVPQTGDNPPNPPGNRTGLEKQT